MRRFLLAAPVGVDPLSALFVSSSDATRLRRLSAHFLPLALLPFPGVDDLSLSFPNDCFPVSLLDDFVVLDDSFDLLNLEFDATDPPDELELKSFDLLNLEFDLCLECLPQFLLGLGHRGLP
uniref:Uncharacterized protein n=1 Tax=Cacopsylla melanoneura TaxID=428564 RepID=A0A8D8WLL6_9HEMI